jgi:hypothetical protein
MVMLQKDVTGMQGLQASLAALASRRGSMLAGLPHRPRKTTCPTAPEIRSRVHIRLIRTYYIFVFYINEINSFEYESYRAASQHRFKLPDCAGEIGAHRAWRRMKKACQVIDLAGFFLQKTYYLERLCIPNSVNTAECE